MPIWHLEVPLVANTASCGRYKMSTDSVFTIASATLSLGAVLSRGSPGITLYKAELLLGQRTLQVQLLYKLLCTPNPAGPATSFDKVAWPFNRWR